MHPFTLIRPALLAATVAATAVLAAAFTVAACATTPGPADPEPADPAPGALPDAVHLTWLSVTNWLLEAGDTRILLDGYLTRIDRALVEADGTSRGTAVTDTAELRRLLWPALPELSADWVLVGHGHWDHAFDVPALARLTGARIVGARTVCHQAVALGVPAERCRAVEGGEWFEAGPGVRVRVVRWHHSGDDGSDVGRRLRAPLELRAPPVVDPATGGLRPGFLDDYPNGGGGRGYLVTVATASGPVTLFWSNSGNPGAWDRVVPADPAWFGEAGVELSHLEWAPADRPTRDALADALRAEGLDRVDLWIGFGGVEHVAQVVEALRPRAFIPHHWDDFWSPMDQGRRGSFDPAPLFPILDPAGARLWLPSRFYDRFRLDARGITMGASRPCPRVVAPSGLAGFDRVRLAAPELWPGRVVGRVTAVDEETVVLAPRRGPELSIPLDRVQTAEAVTGRYRTGPAMAGATVGVFAGYFAGLALHAVRYPRSDLGPLVGLVLGVPAGLVTGAVAGAIVGVPRWEPVVPMPSGVARPPGCPSSRP